MRTGAAGLSNVSDRMRWLQGRSRVLADNIANADTPRFVPKDAAPMASAAGASLAPVATDPRHIGGAGRAGSATANATRLETRPNGNAVSLEDEMLKLSETQLEYQMMTGLYQRSLVTLKTAIGKRS